MSIHEAQVEGGEEISDPVVAANECDCSVNCSNDAHSPSSVSVCAENDFGGDTVSRPSPAEAERHQ